MRMLSSKNTTSDLALRTTHPIPPSTFKKASKKPPGAPRGVSSSRPIPTMGLRRGRQSVRGFAVKEAIILLKCETHMSNTEIAEAIGRSRQWVCGASLKTMELGLCFPCFGVEFPRLKRWGHAASFLSAVFCVLLHYLLQCCCDPYGI